MTKSQSGHYKLINNFEKKLFENGTHILKFFLRISPEEQLLRFRQRLEDSARHWKISEKQLCGARIMGRLHLRL